jgi:hypothetical protein
MRSEMSAVAMVSPPISLALIKPRKSLDKASLSMEGEVFEVKFFSLNVLYMRSTGMTLV